MNHDLFFRSVFAEPEQAASLIRFCLPPAEADLLDLDHLERLPDSYATPEGDDGRCDLLVKCPLKGRDANLLIAVLVEHKSYVDDAAISQMARYWANLILKSGGMPVIPILFYHGDADLDLKPLRELYPWLPEALARYQPDFPVLRIDLAHRDTAEILAAEGLDEMARMGLLALHAVFRGDATVVRIVNDLTQPWLEGYRRPLFGNQSPRIIAGEQTVDAVTVYPLLADGRVEVVRMHDAAGQAPVFWICRCEAGKEIVTGIGPYRKNGLTHHVPHALPSGSLSIRPRSLAWHGPHWCRDSSKSGAVRSDQPKSYPGRS